MIDPSAVIPASSTVWHYCVILRGTTIGEHVSIGSFTEIGFNCRIGDWTRIGAQCFLPSNTVIGQYVFLGPGVRCADDRHPYAHSPMDPPYIAAPPIIDDGASIGMNATILPGVRIGKGAFVAACSVVTHDVPEGVAVKGVPAQRFTLSDKAKSMMRTMEPA